MLVTVAIIVYNYFSCNLDLVISSYNCVYRSTVFYIILI